MILSLRHPVGWLLLGLSAIALLYIVLPLLIFVATTFGQTGYLTFPPHGFTLRWYGEALADPTYLAGFLTSLRIASSVAILSLLIGCMAAWGLVRWRFAGSDLIASLLLSPLALPGVVLAVGLTIFFSRHLGLVGTSRLILAHLVICVPCVVRVLTPVLQRLDRSIEEAALNLGATPPAAFLLVTLPIIRPAMLAAAAFAFILSFDEVEMALFLASPREAPLTAVLYAAAQLAFSPPIAAVSAIMILIVASVLVLWQLAGIARRRP